MLPCGHLGEHVINRYVECVVCDLGAVPTPIDREETQPMHGLPRTPYWSNDPRTCRHGGGKYVWYGWVWCSPCGTKIRRAP